MPWEKLGPPENRKTGPLAKSGENTPKDTDNPLFIALFEGCVFYPVGGRLLPEPCPPKQEALLTACRSL